MNLKHFQTLDKSKTLKIKETFFPKSIAKKIPSSNLNFCSNYLWKKTFLFKQNYIFTFSEKKIFCRSSCIPYSFKNQVVKIYSGKHWHSRVINKWNVGFKFGSLTWNRKPALYKAKQLRKKKKK